MICTTCGNETPDQRLSCSHCGAVLNKECPRCAEIIKIKAKACRYCGYEFSEPIVEQSKLVEKPATPSTLDKNYSENNVLSSTNTANLFTVSKWVWWTITNIIAGAFAFPFIRFVFLKGVTRAIVDNFFDVRYIMFGGIGGILLGAIFGLAQQLQIRNIFPPAKWFWVTLLGYWLGNTVAFSLTAVDSLPAEFKFNFIIPFLVIGLVIGIVQVLSFQQFRQNFSISGYWILSSLLAWTLDVVILRYFLGFGRYPFEVAGINSIFPNQSGYVDGVTIFRQISISEYVLNGIIRGFLIGMLSGLNLYVLHKGKSWARPKTLGIVMGVITLVCIPVWAIWFFATLRQLEITMSTTSIDMSNQNTTTEPPITNTAIPSVTTEPLTSSVIGKWEVVSGTSIGGLYEFFEDGTVSVDGIAGKYSFPDESHLKIEAGIPFVYTYRLSGNEITLTEPTQPTAIMKRYEEFDLTPQAISGKWQKTYPDNSGCFKELGIEFTPQDIRLYRK